MNKEKMLYLILKYIDVSSEKNNFHTLEKITSNFKAEQLEEVISYFEYLISNNYIIGLKVSKNSDVHMNFDFNQPKVTSLGYSYIEEYESPKTRSKVFLLIFLIVFVVLGILFFLWFK